MRKFLFPKKNIFNFIVLAIVIVLLFMSTRATKISLAEEGLKIHGIYGDVYPWDSITDLRLSEELPSIERRTNGAAVASSLKGHFITTEYGPVKLFLDREVPPFIYIETDSGIVIFNTKTAGETEELFREISEKIK